LIEAADKGWWDMAAREGKLLEIFIMTNANHFKSCFQKKIQSIGEECILRNIAEGFGPLRNRLKCSRMKVITSKQCG
jgi:hypothetical protein